MRRTLAGMLVLLPLLWMFGIVTHAAPDDVAVIAPDSGPWDAQGSFQFPTDANKTRRSLSGIACPPKPSGQRICLAAFDEGREARHVVIKDNAYAIDSEPVILRAAAGELDAEAAATDG